MAKPRGQYKLRLAVLPQVPGTQGTSGEYPVSWPDPPAGGPQLYFACAETIDGAELIVLGQRSSTETIRVRIKGRKICVKDVDRVKNTVTNELFDVTGMSRDVIEGETVLTLTRVRQQTTPQ